MICLTRKIILHVGMAVVLVLSSTNMVKAEMQSQNYQINWDSLNSGGLDNSTSTNYLLRDSFGQIVSGFSTSSNYELSSGYRTPGRDADVLNFKVEAEDRESKQAYTVFDDSGTTVTVSSAVGFSIGDHIVVVEDEGAEQLITIGRIESISGNDLIVDFWEGDNGAMSLNAGGGDDFVYRLSGNSVALGTLSYDKVKTGVSFFEITSNYGSGYTVYVKENNNLWDGSNSIIDVSDGSVTQGSEEYGIETVGGYASGSEDFAITTNKQSVANKAGYAEEDRTGIIYKAAVDSNTSQGNYYHTVSYYATVNY